jgi:hypothetical protein
VPVGINQIQEILDVVEQEVGAYRTYRILAKLKLSKAYFSNESYRVTINRLADRFAATHESVPNVVE